MSYKFKTAEGSPLPLGVQEREEGVNFTLYSKHADAVTLCLFSGETNDLVAEIKLNPKINKTGDIWHIFVEDLPPQMCYGFRVRQKSKAAKLLPEQDLLVLDPYARAVNTPSAWGSNDNYRPLGLVRAHKEFDWQGDKQLQIPRKDLVIYEMHVRGFTQHPSSKVKHPGTFLGVVEKIPYLLDLGVNAVELLPVQEFNECEYHRFNPINGERLYNYWGYSTVNFFSPCNRFATKDGYCQAEEEFKFMVRELHKNGIEVILDVVFNHTAEGNELGPVLSFKGVDIAVYYHLDPKLHFQNYSGCGNTMNCNHPMVREFILVCLNYWAREMHVDGFRFDLAAVFARGTHTEVLDSPPLIEAISENPLLSDLKLIAEPWDSAGLYRLGNFYPSEDRWSEWNDKYRDIVKRFIKGDKSVNQEFASRISGSQDIFNGRSPLASLNYITSHDGLSLRDLVSYNQKYNTPNGENNLDGNPSTNSWNCGVEGETKDKAIIALRSRQMRNLHLALMISQGIPMLHMGDEIGLTRKGNNNTWCQDNELNWLDWSSIKGNPFYRFTKGLIHFRKRHAVLNKGEFLTPEDIDWHSREPHNPNWQEETQFLAFTLKDSLQGEHLYVAFNAHDYDATVHLPSLPTGWRWYVIVNTANAPPDDFFHETDAPVIATGRVLLKSYSSLLLKALAD
ncbi:glycogen debranching protein [Estrella lausannensis]|uniref:Glycogen debranching enzyme n=1 Tax=Estrella lausannensis TaxID=483423 RepID=A0A0H5DQ84_9BACT|nr:isoamylase [Estrella lausannensis]CRX38218.1 Glycogen debranching enzyme [Estrella lausannensis]